MNQEVEEDLQFHLQKIKKFIDAIRSFQIKNDYKKNPQNSCFNDEIFFDELHQHLQTKNILNNKDKKENNYILECFIKPTFESLTDNFKEIDELSKIKKTQEESKDLLKKKKRPPAPAGMLSIAQYTDIACLMEYFFYFIIYPYYHQNSFVFSISIPIRIQQLLPKSLRGRMSPGVHQFIPLFSRNTNSIKSSPDNLHTLQTSIHTFANIITQSRFRPMLLPRHLSDLYSLIILHNHFIDIHNKQIYPDKISLELYFAPHIEGTIVAKALQSLLYSTNTHSQNTTKTIPPKANNIHKQNRPLWLRSKVTYWLNRLALIDLSSILYVFVHAAHYLPGATVPTAALHLSRALMNHHKKNNQMTSTISKQIWNQLIYIMYHDDNSKEHENNIEMCGRLVIVSMIPLLTSPESNIHSILYLPKIHSPSIPKIPPFIGIQRLKHLLPVLPPPPFRNHFCYLLLKHDTLDILMEYTVHIWKNVTYVIEKREVLFVMKTMLEYFMEDDVHLIESKKNLESVIRQSVLYLMKAILNPLYSNDNETMSNQDETILNDSENNMISKFEIRCQIVVELIKSIIEQKINIAAPFFQLLLILCYSPKNKHLVGFLQSGRARLVAMTMLPMIFDQCKLDLLLSKTSHTLSEKRKVDATGILHMVGWIIYCAANEINKTDKYCEKSINQEKVILQDFRNILNDWNNDIQKLDYHLSTQSQLDEILENGNISQMNVSTLLSTASICIGLLIAMLELGERKRHHDEEIMLQSFLSNLKILASLPNRSFMNKLNDTVYTNRTEVAEMAEMAAHACGLILARGAEENACHKESLVNDNNNDIQEQNSYHSQIQKAKIDLHSSMPPIRARGAVSILRLARTITEAHDSIHIGHSDENIPFQKSLIMEVDSSNKSVHQTTEKIKDKQVIRDQHLVTLLDELLNVGIHALNDDESYVYMAVIQALSAIADTYPKYVLPKLAMALARGKIYSQTNDEMEKKSTLTYSQRIKTAEAITFAIRRRGEAIAYYCSDLLEEILLGCKVNHTSSSENTILSQQCKRDIQQKTDLYFQHGFTSINENNEIMNDDNAVLLEEQMFRLKTGGPIFDVEEDDAVRSCCFLCLSEVLIILPAQLLASFCNPVIHLCIESLRLDRSRLIRRAASSLAGDLYRFILQDEYTDSLSIAVEFVLANEEALFSALNQCLSSYSMIKEKVLLLDEPTIVRCKEALSARSKCVENGIFAAAKLLAKAKRNNDDAKIPHVIKSMLSNNDTMDNALGKFRITDDFQLDNDV